MDYDFGVEGVAGGEDRVGLGRSRDHFSGEGEKRTVAGLDYVPRIERFHDGRRRGSETVTSKLV